MISTGVVAAAKINNSTIEQTVTRARVVTEGSICKRHKDFENFSGIFIWAAPVLPPRQGGVKGWKWNWKETVI